MPNGISIGLRGCMIWTNCQFATVRFLSLFFYLIGTRAGHTGGPILMIYMSYDVFPRKDVPVGVLLIYLLSMGSDTPKTVIWGV